MGLKGCSLSLSVPADLLVCMLKLEGACSKHQHYVTALSAAYAVLTQKWRRDELSVRDRGQVLVCDAELVHRGHIYMDLAHICGV
jgi:hypothetical protein